MTILGLFVDPELKNTFFPLVYIKLLKLFQKSTISINTTCSPFCCYDPFLQMTVNWLVIYTLV